MSMIRVSAVLSCFLLLCMQLDPCMLARASGVEGVFQEALSSRQACEAGKELLLERIANPADRAEKLEAAAKYAALCGRDFGPAPGELGEEPTRAEILAVARRNQLRCSKEMVRACLPILDGLGETERQSLAALEMSFYLAHGISDVIRAARPVRGEDVVTTLPLRTLDDLSTRSLSLLEAILDDEGENLLPGAAGGEADEAVRKAEDALAELQERTAESIVYRCRAIPDDQYLSATRANIRRIMGRYPDSVVIQQTGSRRLAYLERVEAKNLQSRLKWLEAKEQAETDSE